MGLVSDLYQAIEKYRRFVSLRFPSWLRSAFLNPIESGARRLRGMICFILSSSEATLLVEWCYKRDLYYAVMALCFATLLCHNKFLVLKANTEQHMSENPVYCKWRFKAQQALRSSCEQLLCLDLGQCRGLSLPGTRVQCIIMISLNWSRYNYRNTIYFT